MWRHSPRRPEAITLTPVTVSYGGVFLHCVGLRMALEAAPPIDVAYYSVDRRGMYAVGESLDLYQSDPYSRTLLASHEGLFSSAEIAAHVHQLFPDGLSLHGWEWMTWHSQICTDHNGIKYTHNERAIELAFEFVRRAAFPGQRSRLQSYFAWNSLDDAKAFATAGQPIYRLEPSVVLRADQRWLHLSEQNAIASFQAHRYWTGIGTAAPKWEYVLAAPVKVAEKMS